MPQNSFYPPIEPLSYGRLDVGDGHRLYWEQCGNAEGAPILFLHGGPGAGCRPQHRQFFDPHHYRIILFDQRGAGRSTPHASIKNNRLEDLIEDIEKLRKELGIEKWQIFGGSWGSSLALAYAKTHPMHVKSLILYGIYLMQPSEKAWFLKGISKFFPEYWQNFENFIPKNERGNLLKAYYKRLIDPDPEVHLPAAYTWVLYQDNCLHLDASMPPSYPTDDHKNIALAKIETHYFKTISKKTNLLHNIEILKNIPIDIIQGRYDMICPPASAYNLHKALPHSNLKIIPIAAHSAAAPDLLYALLDAIDSHKDLPK